MLFAFDFFYPFVMSVVWMMGAILFFWRREHRTADALPELRRTPMVSILVPCYNEGAVLGETLVALREIAYPNYEVLVLNDASTDNTLDVVRAAMDSDERIRIVNLPVRRGKAHALNAGVFASRGEIPVTLDADAVIHPDAVHYMVAHFVNAGGERVGAVTGSPRVRNRATLLGKIQVVEYGSIIGLIKRAQRVLGKLMTVSGVLAAFRKRAILECGFWDEDMITDDIAISWKLQRHAWDIRYEPRALCWMWVPEKLRGLWRQRMRWSQGGVEVLIRNISVWKRWTQRRLIPIYLEETVSIVWSYLWLVSLMLLIVEGLHGSVPWNMIRTGGTWLGLMSLCQSVVALFLERRYEPPRFMYYYFYAIWYPALYWAIGAFVVVIATPRAVLRMLRRRTTYATWHSPDRGMSS
ncbi:poly-beta-1,6 N-acetyl-D-glucosamine synthase [Alicyclobacillus hesperidum subsp. aegles]|uniref:poly-beta-1,6-N-acetyl-D-glucosamine synthase n=1 Tax=Alicyclobacillus hesperidum TaxID=89784 RepID=UPI00222DEE39|nr:poly-beta-1,6-N-acetyl-D-glucosamine synthase [Alicyclobacillus hesperidum]GLG01289.1 poly-beta-1,6 N-acetyl-D-glucosamine synthase [Alicyclobacillus hesperidum subsp. aegles]